MNASRFFEETFFDETLVNEAADKPAANRRQQTLPAVMIQAPRAERQEKYKQKTRPADFVKNFLEKFFHVNHLPSKLSARRESRQQIANGECEADADKPIPPNYFAVGN